MLVYRWTSSLGKCKLIELNFKRSSLKKSNRNISNDGENDKLTIRPHFIVTLFILIFHKL